MDGNYRFLIRGHLDDYWSEWLGGLEIQRRKDGTTVLSGPVADQAALHGVIAGIRDLGLPLLAVDRTAEPHESTLGEARGSPGSASNAHQHRNFVEPLSEQTMVNEGDTPCD